MMWRRQGDRGGAHGCFCTSCIVLAVTITLHKMFSTYASKDAQLGVGNTCFLYPQTSVSRFLGHLCHLALAMTKSGSTSVPRGVARKVLKKSKGEMPFPLEPTPQTRDPRQRQLRNILAGLNHLKAPIASSLPVPAEIDRSCPKGSGHLRPKQMSYAKLGHLSFIRKSHSFKAIGSTVLGLAPTNLVVSKRIFSLGPGGHRHGNIPFTISY